MLIKAFTKDLSPTRLPPHGRGSQTYIEILAISKLSMELHFLKPSDIFVDQECSQVPRKHWTVIFRDLVFQLMTSSGIMTEILWWNPGSDAHVLLRHGERRDRDDVVRLLDGVAVVTHLRRRDDRCLSRRHDRWRTCWAQPCQSPDPKLGSRW